MRGTGFEHTLNSAPSFIQHTKETPEYFREKYENIRESLILQQNDERVACQQKNNQLSSQTISFTCQLINLLA